MKENKKINKNDNPYVIGLDIGTASVGYAVMNTSGQLLKKDGEKLWGYDLFDSAETAANRRTFRSARRMLKRKKQRVHLLQDMCEEMVNAVDKDFFRKLEYSYLVEEDRFDDKPESGLFSGEYSDRDFYNEFPTIYHLRKKLCESDKKADPRIVYLALHHIVKYRGNFIYEGQNLSEISNIANINEKLELVLSNYFEDSIISSNKIINILFDDGSNGKDKVNKVKGLSTTQDEKKILEAISNAILGFKFNVSALTDGAYDLKISFKDEDIDEQMDKVDEDSRETIVSLRLAYNYNVIRNILKNSKEMLLSDNMIEIYEKHKKDLKVLKNVLRDNDETRKLVLSSTGIYENYINGDKDYTAFLKELNKSISKLKDSNDKKYILDEINNESFLPRQNTTDNSEIPYQLHLNELKAILDKQEKFYKCLKNNREKIEKLVSTRLPYYVGPLNSDSNFAWIKYKDNADKGNINLLNWEEKIDIDKTASEFINGRRNCCTYILEEKTLPKNSILLNRYNLLNELNKIKIDNNHYAISDPLTKELIINDLFLSKSEITKQDLNKWLLNNQIYTQDKIENLSGFQGDNKFSSSLKTEIKFRNIFGDEFNNRISEIEKIIEYLTIYNEKSIIERKLKEFNLTDEQFKKISRINLSGYGRLSKKLIFGIPVNNLNSKHNGQCIFEIMQKTNMNFMEILNNKEFNYLDEISKLNGIDENSVPNVTDIANLPGSPAIKRAIWQSIRVVMDLVKYEKHNPETIYIEFAREEKEKKRTNTRYQKLEKIYKEYISNSDLLHELKDSKEILNLNDRLYLYFIQKGKCLYSDEALDINNLENYQIDHILPQSYVKDDSIENKALVLSKYNQRKKDSLLLENSIIEKMEGKWIELYKQNLIGEKKLKNLRRRFISDIEKINFIQRQLVETRQICIHVKDILKKYYPDTNIVTVHAPLSAEFRSKYNLYKIREINNVHHAQDAFLAARIGLFINKKLPYLYNQSNTPNRFIEQEIRDRIDKENENRRNGKAKTIYSFVINQMSNKEIFDAKTGELLWGGNKEIEYISKLFNSKHYFSNRMTYCSDSAIANQNQVKKDVAKIQKKNNMQKDKYGGYTSINIAYLMAIEYMNRGNKKREIVSIPIIFANNPEEYLFKEKGNETKILMKLPLYTTIIESNITYSLASAAEWKIDYPLFVGDKCLEVIYKIKTEMQVDDNDLNNCFNELIDKATTIPRFKKTIESKLHFDSKGNCKEYICLNNEDKIRAINSLIYNFTNSGSEFKIGNLKVDSRFGRISGKTTNLDDIQIVFTSPSGIYKKIIKL